MMYHWKGLHFSVQGGGGERASPISVGEGASPISVEGASPFSVEEARPISVEEGASPISVGEGASPFL